MDRPLTTLPPIESDRLFMHPLGPDDAEAFQVMTDEPAITDVKGRPIDIKLIGRELGVRYVLEGGVRKAGQRVRITGQLIEADNGTGPSHQKLVIVR